MEITFIIEMRNMGQIESIPHCSRHTPCAFLKEKRSSLTLHSLLFSFALVGRDVMPDCVTVGGRVAWEERGALVPGSFAFSRSQP